MKFNTLGILMQRIREREHLSLQDVCDGICSQATLSRIEQGHRETDSLTGEMLLGRLGREMTRFELVLDAKDYELNELREQIRLSLEEQNYRQAKQKLARYRKLLTPLSKVHEQFCGYMEYLLMNGRGDFGDSDPASFLLETIHYTMPDYEMGAGQKRLYSPMELSLIQEYIKYAPEEQQAAAEKELLSLLRFVRQFYSIKQQEKTGVPILMDLIAAKDRQSDAASVIRYADMALKSISLGVGIKYVGELHLLKAKALEQTGPNGESPKEWMRKRKLECLMAYCVFDLTERPEERDAVVLYSKEKLKWQITEQMMLSV